MAFSDWLIVGKGVESDFFLKGNNVKITTQRRFASLQSNFDSR